ncbi:MAG: sulfite exporter TauE/SafE family protein [Chloroflexota bacterium]|nr:MAG: sulfite exporter TauE/SafE family protein [Chloroflexota bacterium]
MASAANGIDLRERWVAIAIVGVLTGLLSGLLGIGGAAILVPGLVDVLGMSQHRASGTSLFVIIPTAVVAAIVYALGAQMDWPLVALFSVTAVVGALLGTVLNARMSAGLLRRLFGAFLLFVAIRLLIPGGPASDAPPPPSVLVQDSIVTIGEAVLGLVAGFMSGLLGIGGGQILTPGMIFLFDIPQKLAQGISIAFIVPTAISGALAHYRRGNVEARVGIVLIPCSMVSGVVGAWLVQFIDASNLRFGFALFLLYASSRMLAPRVWTSLLRRGRTA